MLLKKLPHGNWLYPRMSRGLSNRTSFLSACQTLLPRKAFPNDPQRTEGTANVGTAVLELLNHPLLYTEQHFQEELKTYSTKQMQSTCWIYQIHSEKLKSLEPKSIPAPFPNQQYPLMWHRYDHPALAIFSRLRALSAMRTLMQAWTQMKQPGQFHPIPFLSFQAIGDTQDLYFTSQKCTFEHM